MHRSFTRPGLSFIWPIREHRHRKAQVSPPASCRLPFRGPRHCLIKCTAWAWSKNTIILYLYLQTHKNLHTREPQMHLVDPQNSTLNLLFSGVQWLHTSTCTHTWRKTIQTKPILLLPYVPQARCSSSIYSSTYYRLFQGTILGDVSWSSHFCKGRCAGVKKSEDQLKLELELCVQANTHLGAFIF